MPKYDVEIVGVVSWVGQQTGNLNADPTLTGTEPWIVMDCEINSNSCF